MSVIVEPLSSALIVVYQDGYTPGGGPVSRQKSIAYVRNEASAERLYEIAHALFDLSLHSVLDVQLRKNFRLAEE